MYGVAAALGVICVALLAIGGRYFSSVVPEWAAQLAWLAIVLGGSALCGYLRPVRAWRWGAVIVGVQPPCAAVLLLLVGELSKPSSSMGGPVAVLIFAAVMAFVSPIAMLASYLGSRARASQPPGHGA
jgi:hypothetical protein